MKILTKLDGESRKTKLKHTNLDLIKTMIKIFLLHMMVLVHNISFRCIKMPYW